MARCSNCGRGGLFRKVNSDGLCEDCAALKKLEARKESLNNEIKEIETTLSDKEKVYEEIKNKAEKDALDKAQKELQEFELKRAKAETDMLDMQAKRAEAEAECEKRTKASNAAIKKVRISKEIIKAIQYAEDVFDSPNEENEKIGTDALLERINEFLEPTVQLELQCMAMRDLRKLYKENEKQIEKTLKRYEGRYTTKANTTIYQLMVIALRAELQNILYNIKFGKLEDAVANVKEVTAKYYEIATNGNKSIASTMKKFIGEMEYLFIEAVKIEYEYYVQKERAKEEQRAIREQMRQEAEERRELERQQKQVEKEESKFKDEILHLEEQLSNESDDEKLDALKDRIKELQEQLADVAEKKERIIHLQNGKAGNVYVISNVGSFGDDVFKVGMTRRLNPQERVDELGSASVPFPFDVHSMIFSNDAVSLETHLHHILHEKRVNKVNLRKEFFRVSLDEIEALVAEIAPTAEFKRTILAEQYRQSLSIDHVGEVNESNTDEDDDDDD